MAPSCSGFSHPVALINIKQLKRSAVIEKWLLLKLTFRTYLFVFSRETHDPNTVLKRTPPPLPPPPFSPPPFPPIRFPPPMGEPRVPPQLFPPMIFLLLTVATY